MISCKCITYGRVSFLEEAINSFLKQDYQGDKELIIVNDCPFQKLYYSHPEITIYNIPETFKTIGEKENFAVSQCRGEIIALWDDDDIALPNHLSNVEKYMKDNDWIQWQKGINCVDFEIQAINSVGVSGMVYRKSAVITIGGFPLENAGYDISFIGRLQKYNLKYEPISPPDNEVSWIYNWGNGSYHMSGLGTDTPDRPNVIQRHSEHIENLRQLGKIPEGKIILQPYWRKDYVRMLNDYLIK